MSDFSCLHSILVKLARHSMHTNFGQTSTLHVKTLISGKRAASLTLLLVAKKFKQNSTLTPFLLLISDVSNSSHFKINLEKERLLGKWHKRHS